MTHIKYILFLHQLPRGVQNSQDQQFSTLGSLDAFLLLQYIEDAKDLGFLWVIATDIYTMLEIKTSIYFKSFQNNKSLYVKHKHILWKSHYIFQNENLRGGGTILHFCKSPVSLNQRQLDFHIYFYIQCMVICFRLKYMKKIWPHTDMLSEKGRAFQWPFQITTYRILW